MKVLLAYRPNPRYNDPDTNIFPNGLYYIASLLKDKGHNVHLKNFSRYNINEIKDEIKNLSPEILGLSCYTFNAVNTFELCDIIKDINKQIKVVLGGPHATALCDEILKRIKNIDIIVKGEGEETFLELATSGLDNLKNIKGISYKKGDVIIHNLSREPINDLNSLTIPSKYYKYQRIITSRGCPGECTFCSTPNFWGRNIRFRNPRNIIEEIELLHKNYGLSYFVFSDDTFTCNKKRTIEICKLIIEKGLKITWDCRSRVNFIDEEQLTWMKKAGCISISYGVESGSERILKNINKHITIDQIIKASKITKKLGLQLAFFLIVGSPGENEESIQETINLLKLTKPHKVLIAIMNLTPDIDLCKNVDMDFWFKEMLEPHYYTSELSLEALMNFGKKINTEFQKYKGQYSMDELIAIIKKDPSSFQAFNYLGGLYLSKNMLKDALICFLKAIKLNPGFAQANNNIGIVAIKSGQKEKALECFKKAAKQNPEGLAAVTNAGRVYLEKGEIKKAKVYFKSALERKPKDQQIKKYLDMIKKDEM